MRTGDDLRRETINKVNTQELIIIGGGLAGSEAAWQAARLGVGVVLYEMRPARMTEAHKTQLFAELVCSNSLRSRELVTGPGLLKREMEIGGSLIMEAAKGAEVPAGSALAVDRKLFAGAVTEALTGHPLIRIVREEVSEIPASPCIIATGPLTTPSLSSEIRSLIGEDHLSFYDAISPIVDADSIDYAKVYSASRYGKGGDDYLNCPMTPEEYDRFYDALREADTVRVRSFEDDRVFEGCMPVEAMAARGRDTLRFGPLKPVGLVDPRTGKIPHAVVQLRMENREKTAYNLVGFQTRLTHPYQEKILSMIPGLEHAEILRYGSIHRNTYMNAPEHLGQDLTLREKENVYVAGQITGVEGYIESAAMGFIAGVNAARRMKGEAFIPPPGTSAHGSLVRFLIGKPTGAFQPSNIHFGLLPGDEQVQRVRDKKQRRMLMAGRAIADWEDYIRGIFG